MTEYFDGFNNDGDAGNSSIFQARIREEDLTSAQKIDEIARAADKLVRKALLQDQSYEQINQQVHTKLDGLLCRIESYVEESDSSDAEGVLQIIYEMIKNFFDAFGISVKGQNFKMKLLKKAKDKSWLASIIKELCSKLRKLLGKIFTQDLGWEEALEKEIKELQKKLDSGDLSQEETVAALERLEALRTMKLKFQMAFMSFVLTSFFTLLEIELGAAIAQETSTEEDKKTESKEPEVKQAKEIAAGEGEVKATEKNKNVQPENLERPLRNPREIIDGKEKPIIPPLKPDLDLFKLLENLKPEKFIESKQQTQEKPKLADSVPTPPQPAATQPQPPAKVPEPVQSPATTSGSCKYERGWTDSINDIDKIEVSTTKSIDENKMGNLYAKLAQKIAIAKEKPDMGKHNVAQAEPINNQVRSELNEVKKVEHLNEAMEINCGRGI